MINNKKDKASIDIQVLLDEIETRNQRKLTIPVLTPRPRPRLHGRKAGNIIYMTRIVNHITQAALANTVGVSRQTIIDIENRRKAPSVFLALAIAEALDSRVEDIFQLH